MPDDYLILSKVEGNNVIDSWDNLSAGGNEQIAFAAGKYLAVMHNHSTMQDDLARHKRDSDTAQ